MGFLGSNMTDTQVINYMNLMFLYQYAIGTFTFVPFGFVFNTLQVIVFANKKFKAGNIGFMSQLFAIACQIGLTWNFVLYKYVAAIGLNISNLNSFTCATFQWASRCFQQLPLYVQAYVTLINYFRVAYPFKFHALKKDRNIFITMCIVIVIDWILNSTNCLRYLSYTYSSKNETIFNPDLNQTQIITKTIVTKQSCTATNFNYILSYLATSLMRSILPTIFMITLDILVINLLFNSKNKMAKNKDIDTSKEKKFAIVLLVLDVIFFVFNFPLSCTEILVIVYQNIYMYPANSPTMVFVNTLHGFANSWAFIYLTIPFFINYYFNKSFKLQLRLFFIRTFCGNQAVNIYMQKNKLNATNATQSKITNVQN